MEDLTREPDPASLFADSKDFAEMTSEIKELRGRVADLESERVKLKAKVKSLGKRLRKHRGSPPAAPCARRRRPSDGRPPRK